MIRGIKRGMKKKGSVKSRMAFGVGTMAVLFTLTTGVSTIHAQDNSAQVTASSAAASFDWNQQDQKIEGFGASGAFGKAGQLQNFADEKTRSYLLDQLFSTKDGAGLSMVRSLVGDGVSNPTIEPSLGQWSWTASSGFSDDQIWLMDSAKQYGVHTFMSSVWSPPAWMKANDNVNGGGTNNYLLPSHYQDFANYLVQYILGYKEHFGINISAISIQNEPNENVSYASCTWTAEQFDTFIRDYLNPTFQKYRIQTKVIMPEQANWSDQLAQNTLNDPAAASGVQVIAAHDYWGTIQPFTDALAQHKEVWQTETMTSGPDNPSITDGLKWAKNINDFMTIADASAWNYWWLTRAGNQVDWTQHPNDALINFNPTNNTYIINKRLYTIGNFSRFVRPGYYRISGTSNPSPGVYMSAYKNDKNGKFSVVVINQNTSAQELTTSIPGAKFKSVVPYVTSATENLEKGSDIKVNDSSFTTTLEPQSVTTFVGKGEPSGK